MKVIKIIFLAFLSYVLTSCYDLTLEPKGILGETELFGSEAGIKMYFAGLYGKLPIEDFLYMARNSDGYQKNNNSADDPWGTWEAMKHNLQNMSGEFVNSWIQVNNDGPDYWPYGNIREVNTFINSFPNYKSNFSADVYNNLLGEARFLRAFFYFGMAKLYGGVPIITTVQSPFDPPEVLNVKRNTEYETWKFIHDDLQFAIDNLPGSKDAAKDVTRANKFTAAALMSRTMLYAGTIAKYSQYLGFQNEAAYQKGLAGMEPSKANEFFQYAYDAGKIVESGGYALYTAKYPDKAANFASLFLDPASTENIFIKTYTQAAHDGDPQKTFLIPHSWDAGMSPYPSMSSFVGSQSYPALDLMRMYELPDNFIVNPDGTPKHFKARGDIREGMEPRMRGCMYFSGDELRGTTFAIGRGLYKTFPYKASDIKDGLETEVPNQNGNRIVSNRSGRDELYNGILILPIHGTRNNEGGENNCLTGAFVRKYVNPNMPLNNAREHQSVQPWIVFRLGEIYLNTAEAAYELGKKSEAFDYVEKIRVRAGCKVTRPADDPTDLSAKYGYPIDGNLQFIRDERYRELWGEQHRWWDLRRWRVADRVLDHWIPRILSCYYVIDKDDYIYLDEQEMGNRTWTAEKKSYYQSIPAGEINKNPELLPQNPLR